MTALRGFASCVRDLFQGARRDRELTKEIQTHLDLLADDYERSGVSPEDARAAARRGLGGSQQIRERCRDERRLPLVGDLTKDVRFAARLLVKDRWFTSSAVIALALGIAASTIVFTIVNAMVLRGLPVDQPDRIVSFGDAGGAPLSISYRDVEDWRRANRTFAGVAAYSHGSMTVGDEGRSPEAFPGAYVSAETFRLIHEKPILGRDFLAEDDRPGAPAVVILGHTVWTSRYGGDPAIVGRTIRVNNVPAIVIGVMGQGVRFPLIDELWQPLGRMPGLITEKREARTLRAFGRLADGITMRQAQAELDTIASRLSQEYPGTNKDGRAFILPFTGTATNPMFMALAGAVAFVLFIACANVANLLLARSTRRTREISVRLSLGATRWRIVRQLLVESLCLAMVAGLLGFALSVAGVRLFAHAVAGINFAYWYHERWTMDGRVFTFLAAVCLMTALAFGLVPALHLSKPDVNESLKDGSRTSVGSGRARRWMSALLIAELAFTLTLLAGAFLMMRSFLAVYRADLVVDPSRVLAVSLRLPNQKYSTPAQRIAFYQRLEERFGGMRPVSAVSVASTVPFIGAPMWHMAVEGRPPTAGAPPLRVSFVTVGPRYFEALGLGLLRGRVFTSDDGTAGHESAIVSQRFVALFFAGEDPIGRRIHLTNPNAAGAAPLAATIVGVSPTVRQQFMSEIDPVVYLPYRAAASTAAMLMVRGLSDATAITALVREEIHALDPDVPVNRVMPLDVYMRQSRWGHRVFSTMFACFAGIALLLSVVGLYAVTAYAVIQRTQEIGVRIAIGAQPRQVIWLFVRRAVPPLVIGLAIGLGGAFGIGRLIRMFLVQTSPTDPVALFGTAALLVVASVAACFFPARRATRLDPVTALRYE